MINELFPFQRQAVNELRFCTAMALSHYRMLRVPQVVSLQAPTGSGKTIIMSALIEDIYFGTDNFTEQPERFTDEDGRCDRLTLGEISQALGSTPFRTEKLTLIGFDACLMGSLETALTVSPFAEYMTASPDIETDSGWDYGFLRDLTGDENGAALSEGIIASYEASLKDYRGPVTLVCLDLGRSEAVLEKGIG